jgi:hypothetical protein
VTDQEIVLTGGNMTPVVRVGDTVRRSAGPWTPTIHALLRHVANPGVAEQARRLARFCAAYGEPGIQSRVAETAVAILRELAAFIQPEAAAGDPAQTAVLERGRRRHLRARHRVRRGAAQPARLASSTNQSSASGLASESRLAAFSGSVPERIRFTGTSSSLPDSVRGTSSTA